ncbi:tripartite tricarboxylate transporter substrate binding protein [Pseudoroseomonas wenyumeiae]|uniref:Tripartite tricarboxylate transporter substrate binding protein n=1 Tax=Teichococcus wenyumeiae TaxID=2478470 RepID=A0A3A9JD16_9PROT|nr:tripartite tricarboxylate transporter substrate-binding protein [Pseudoroseomonas wenyumeiae]RKK04060.1 tripartite tricarboxylate transporter substrate binding protein [Pseudoroseomonas wenyumeiae]RMI20236.1 tripartite tricarboxylate transporter substrate binding protein [Pseudoroseomonas wenyumeiae]
MKRRMVLTAGLALPALFPAGRAQAQNASAAWPARAVTIVEGYPPGGVTDLASRAVAERMTQELGVPVVVDNRPGAATSVAATAVARARPDGYTLVMGTTTLAINPTLQPNLTPKDPGRELDPVGMVFQTPFILHVHPSVPVRTTAELIDYAKANPGKLSFASPGTGAVSHLCLELFKARTGIDILHVPYRGGAPAALDLRQGRVQAMFQAPQEAAATLREGATRGLSVTAPFRLPDYPDLPPIGETLPGFEVFFWQGLFAPTGTPAPVVARAAAALRASTEDPTIRARLAEQGVQLISGDAGVLRQALAADTARWGSVIREANIRLE